MAYPREARATNGWGQSNSWGAQAAAAPGQQEWGGIQPTPIVQKQEWGGIQATPITPKQEWAPPAPVAPVDWDSARLTPFKRAFIPLPTQESWNAGTQREASGICIEDLGSLAAVPEPVQLFEELPIPQYAIDSLKEVNIVAPLPIQAQALPLVMGGCDLIGLAQTGSGKTLAFLLPALTHIEDQRPARWGSAPSAPIVLVLAPTRELAVQISDEAKKVLANSKQGNHSRGIWAACLYGGGKRYLQEREAKGSQIVVATPGRLIDFMNSQIVTLESVTYLVLDEADRMLDMGFSGDVNMISGQIRPDRQVLFFSATWSATVQDLASKLCHKGARPVRISYGQHRQADGQNETTARHARAGITQEIVVVDVPGDYKAQETQKQAILDEKLHGILEANEENKVLVFVSQKGYADELATKLWEAGFTAGAMHGGKNQESRLWTLDQFRKGELRLLVATDVLGRGIDIPDVSHVIIYEMGSIDDYIHRIGRTARGKDAKGHALVFFEYYWKCPEIAGELCEVLIASEQAVPPELARIADEVKAGKREVFGQGGKWGRGGGNNDWKSGGWNGKSDWKSGGSNDWKSQGASNGDWKAEGASGKRWDDASWKGRDEEAMEGEDEEDVVGTVPAILPTILKTGLGSKRGKPSPSSSSSSRRKYRRASPSVGRNVRPTPLGRRRPRSSSDDDDEDNAPRRRKRSSSDSSSRTRQDRRRRRSPVRRGRRRRRRVRQLGIQTKTKQPRQQPRRRGRKLENSKAPGPAKILPKLGSRC